MIRTDYKPTNASFKDLAGKDFNNIKVLEFSHTIRYSVRTPHHFWKCQCHCGNVFIIDGTALKSGQRSCGCLQYLLISEANKGHGLTKTSAHSTWGRIKQRCYNPKCSQYHNYGGRGIKMCDRWQSFENFLADMGQRPADKTSIDRINNDGDYEPGNCRWATSKEQSYNTRTSLNAKGYCFIKSKKKWVAYSTGKGKAVRLGHFKTEEEAKEAIYLYRTEKQLKHGL